MKEKMDFDDQVWEDADYFYSLRIGLYHEDSGKTVADEIIENFQELVEFIIDKLFNIKCSDLTSIPESLIPIYTTTNLSSDKMESVDSDTSFIGNTVDERIPLDNIQEKINVILVAIAE